MKKTQHLRTAFFSRRRVPDCPVYDLHGHMGPVYGLHINRESAAQADAVLKRNGVRLLVFCHHAALLCPDIGNAANIVAVRAFPERLRAYCGINPNYPDQIEKDLTSFDRYPDVYVGFKFHASFHAIPITDARYEPAWALADERGLPILLHTWGNDPQCGYTVIRQVAERYHRAPILLGHSCHGAWDEAIRLVKDFPNVYLELCAVMDERGILERFVEELGSTRIVFGTDYPWFSHHYYIGAVLGSGIGDEDCRNIFYRNAKRILGK
ncbi:MAG: amidohydrolase family protein [Verrucomicrobia bacterium]|nr:amidohydrolase family protein [Verrucomicrobiota bacterium]MCG2681198.1 amidohydrolase family protein [Kiritimatiellia bacterium]MBU4246780.1 amidohydrolase family protein [Verrucomicrobiota bacterium]MBU4290586.1 amidohydrolase family protein [Verrucomicrobiota bacterium]MBU4429727.1 amidohydrolase family protein [Verrucomicrobiota bacterium]